MTTKIDIEYARISHVSGFSTMIFRSDEKVFSIYDLQKYNVYIDALEKCKI